MPTWQLKSLAPFHGMVWHTQINPRVLVHKKLNHWSPTAKLQCLVETARQHSSRVLWYLCGGFFSSFYSINGLNCMTIKDGHLQGNFRDVKVFTLGLILFSACVSFRLIMDTDNMPHREMFQQIIKLFLLPANHKRVARINLQEIFKITEQLQWGGTLEPEKFFFLSCPSGRNYPVETYS